jgi:geranylgeranyl pyrophosphate synthase
VSALATLREAPGLEEYLDALEERLARAVATHPGVVAQVGNEALAAGGKRLRPLLVFLSTPPGREPSLAAGVAVELVHMATLVHDDLIDRAHFRRGKAAAWSVHGPDAARATGDYLFARAFSELAATGDGRGVVILADATLCLALGVAFQIADDILDCSGATIETGKIAGTDLRDGTPTLPLLLAAQRDDVVRKALGGGPLEGALVRVAATGALEESRHVALDYAARARESLNGELHRERLEFLTHAVVDRER